MADRRWQKFLNTEADWKNKKFMALYKFVTERIKGTKKPPVHTNTQGDRSS